MPQDNVAEHDDSVAVGRSRCDKRLWFDPTPLQLIHERWTTELGAYWAARLTRHKYDAEGAELRALPRRTALTARKARKHG